MRSSLIIFDHLDDDDVAWIQQACRTQAVAAGSVLIESGEVNRNVYLLLEGRCRVNAPDGKPLGTLAAGDLMGEVSFVDKRKTVARITADGGAVVGVLDEAVLTDKIETDTAFAARFYRAVASVLAFRLRRNLQAAITGDVNVLDSEQEFAGEIDAVDLDATAKAGARLSHLLKHLL
jgi:CRP/FNR family cyclic AMP-dependent transcriptional regulator